MATSLEIKSFIPPNISAALNRCLPLQFTTKAVETTSVYAALNNRLFGISAIVTPCLQPHLAITTTIISRPRQRLSITCDDSHCPINSGNCINSPSIPLHRPLLAHCCPSSFGSEALVFSDGVSRFFLRLVTASGFSTSLYLRYYQTPKLYIRPQ